MFDIGAILEIETVLSDNLPIVQSSACIRDGRPRLASNNCPERVAGLQHNRHHVEHCNEYPACCCYRESNGWSMYHIIDIIALILGGIETKDES